MAKGRWRDYNDPREAIAQSLMQQGMSNAPVTDWAGGLNRVLQALGGAYLGFKGGKDNDKVSAAMAGKLGISPEEASFLGDDAMRDMYQDKFLPSTPETFGTTPYQGADKKAYVRGNRGSVKEAMEGLLPKMDDLPTSVQEYQYGQQDPGFRAAQERVQAMKREMTPYQEGMLGMKRQGLEQSMALGQQRLAQSGQMSPYQEGMLGLQRQKMARGGASPAMMELLPVEQAMSEGFPKGTVVQQNKKTGARSVLHRPQALGKPAAAQQRSPLATTAQDVDLARSFMTGEGAGLKSASGATPSDLSLEEQDILARHVADLGRSVQITGRTFPTAVRMIAGKKGQSRVDSMSDEQLFDADDLSPAEFARGKTRLLKAGYIFK